MPSPHTGPSCGNRGKARYVSPTMGVIRDQKVQMAKKLKDLRREMKKEPTSVTDTRVG